MCCCKNMQRYYKQNYARMPILTIASILLSQKPFAATMMRSLVALVLVVSASAAFDKIVAEVNAANAGWTAEAPTARFGSMDDVRILCGTWMPGHPNHTATELPTYKADENAVFADSIDWRTAASNCTVISKIRDQSACGSCWAFGSTETFEDRRCIATGKDIEFSSDDTAGCCSGMYCGMSQGCSGGQPSAALKWMGKTGVVTGGDFTDIGSGSSCKPYELQPCAHHVPATSKYPVCPSSEYSLKCVKSCSESTYPTAYAADKVAEGHAASCYTMDQMMTAMTKGPLSVAFTVYEDFPTYKSGVYKHVSGKALGGHAVEVIGYGTDAGTDYWLVKNSWTEMWGDGGTFKSVRGTNECGIESQVAAIEF
jgi:cathepsin B